MVAPADARPRLNAIRNRYMAARIHIIGEDIALPDEEWVDAAFWSAFEDGDAAFCDVLAAFVERVLDLGRGVPWGLCTGHA